MEPPLEYTLEECNAGGWKARFDPDRYQEIAARIRDTVDPDVDTEHMLLWHMEDVKISFVKSSGVMTIRTDDRDDAERLVSASINQ